MDPQQQNDLNTIKAKFRYLAVEGPIGVGKTSLVDRLSAALGANTLKEDVRNPFLEDFYNEKPGAAFQAQLFFLLNRYQQIQNLQQPGLFPEILVADYIFEKDRIFAYLTLTDAELVVYERLYNMLVEGMPRPDLVLYLQGSKEVLLERVHKRARPMEASISEDYLDELKKAYDYYFFHHKGSPLLVINTDEIDFVKQQDDLWDLIHQMALMEKGVQYYVPQGAGS